MAISKSFPALAEPAAQPSVERVEQGSHCLGLAGLGQAHLLPALTLLELVVALRRQLIAEAERVGSRSGRGNAGCAIRVCHLCGPFLL
jgi:hypothetical protein